MTPTRPPTRQGNSLFTSSLVCGVVGGCFLFLACSSNDDARQLTVASGGQSGSSQGGSNAGANAGGSNTAGSSGTNQATGGSTTTGTAGQFGQGGNSATAGAAGSSGGTSGTSGSGGAIEPSIHVAIVGDFGVDDLHELAVSELIKQTNPDFVITMGDNNYPDGEASTIDANIGKYYASFIAPYSGTYGPGATENKFFPCPGNHDWNTGTLQPYLDYFELPNNERYYDFVRGSVHFFSLDSDSLEPDGITSTSTQAQWLQAKLAASTAPFKVVYFHHPPHSSGEHGDSITMQWPFKEWGASAILNGHDHTYERFTFDGVPYIVCGFGGAGLYDFLSIKPESQVHYNAKHGACFIDANSQRLVFTALNVDFELVDSITILPGQMVQQPTVLIPKGDIWRYWYTPSEQPGWIDESFDDSSWPQGNAPFGYGDTGLMTTLDQGPDPLNKPITAYFRKSFDHNSSTPLLLQYGLRRDDGAVIYLNGIEVARSNMPTGPISPNTLAPLTIGGPDETTFFLGEIDPSLLRNGSNTLAVEVHQTAASSSDLGFDFELLASGD